MKGLRQVRQSLKAIRDELGGGVNRLVTIEAGADVDDAAVEALLDGQLGTVRDHCLIIHLVRFAAAHPPRIIHNQPYGGRP